MENMELVMHEKSGVLLHCFVLDQDGGRLAELPIVEAREAFRVRQPGVVSIDIHSFRVKRTKAVS